MNTWAAVQGVGFIQAAVQKTEANNMDNISNNERRLRLIDMTQGKPPRLTEIKTPDGRQFVIWRIGRGVIKMPLTEYKALQQIALK